MNERIRELAKQSDKIVKSQHPNADMNTGVVIMMDVFAELIVRECANFIDSKLEMTEYSHEVVSWADGDDLKEHFGVE